VCGSRAAIDEAGFYLEATRSFANLPALVTLPALTMVADRVGRRPVLCASVVGMALDALAIALCDSLNSLVVLHSATGLLGSLWLALAIACAIRADVTRVGDGERAGAFAAIETAVMCAALTGPFCLGFLADRIGERKVLLGCSVSLFLLAACIHLLLTETLPNALRKSPGEFGRLREGPGESGGLRDSVQDTGQEQPCAEWNESTEGLLIAHPSSRCSKAGACLLSASPFAPFGLLCCGGRTYSGGAPAVMDGAAVRRVGALMGLTWGAMRGCEFLFVPYARAQFGWEDTALGRYSSACACVTVVGNLLLAASPLRRVPTRTLCMLGAVASASGCALYAASGGGRGYCFWAGGVLYSLATFLSPLLRAMLSRHIRPDAQARALGCAAALESLCALCAPLVFGPLLRSLEAKSAEPLAYALAGVLFVLMLPLLATHTPEAEANDKSNNIPSVLSINGASAYAPAAAAAAATATAATAAAAGATAAATAAAATGSQVVDHVTDQERTCPPPPRLLPAVNGRRLGAPVVPPPGLPAELCEPLLDPVADREG